jgi:lipoate-protein ligase A
MEGVLILDGKATGQVNMDRDLAMAAIAERENRVLLRLYGWEPFCLSLGRFQRIEDIPASLAQHLTPEQIVHRKTGGGAILHHHDLTYSVAMPDRFAKGQLRDLYCCVHNSIRRWLVGHGCATSPWGGGSVGQDFMCFERRSEQDLVLDGHKLLGSAQRRVGETVLQHGSLLLEHSIHYPTLRGLVDLGFARSDWSPKTSDNATEMSRSICEGITAKFGVSWTEQRDFDLE